MGAVTDHARRPSGLRLAQQLRQLGDVGGDAPGLVECSGMKQSHDGGRSRLSLEDEFVPDVARRGRKSNAARLPPSGLVDLALVANGQLAGCFLSDKDRVTHFSTGITVRAFDLFPKSKPPEFEFRQLLFDFPAQTTFFTLPRTFSTTGEHPQSVAPSPNQKYPATFQRNEF